MTESDALLIRRSVAEPELFSVVFERHHRAIFRFVTRRLGGDDAGAVASEVFLHAFAAREQYVAAHATALPWLYGIANRLVANHRRRELRHLEREAAARSREGDLVAIDPSEDIAGSVDSQLAWPRLAGALAELPDDQRDTFLLLAWGDLTYTQIGVALDVPVGTVRSRISRARDHLRSALLPQDREGSGSHG